MTVAPLLWVLAALAAMLVVRRRPIYAAALLLAALPTYLLRTKIAGLPTTLLEAVLLGTIISFFLPSVLRTTHYALRTTHYFLPALALLLIGVVSILIAPDKLAALGLWRSYILEPILALPVFFTSLRDERGRRLALRALAAVALAIAAAALLQVIGVLKIIEPWAAERRATGLYPFPNAVGLFLGPLIPFFAALAAKIKTDRLLYILAAVLSFLGIIASQTEAAIAGALVALLFLAFISGKKARITAIVCLVIFSVFIFGSGARETLIKKATLQDWSGTVRRVMWRETVEMLLTRPILGAGLSGYPAAVAPFHKDPKVEIFQYPHNIVLNFWSELGLAGVAVWIWILWIFARSLKLRKKDETEPLRLAAGLAILAMLIHGLVDVPYFKNDLAVLTWFFLVLPQVTRPEKNGMVV